MDIKREMEENGFVVLRSVFEEDELNEIRSLTDKIVSYFNNEKHDAFSPYFFQHRTDQGALYDLYFRHPEFRRMAENSNILSSLKLIIGENILLYENSLVYKPKASSNEVPWHQDFMNRTSEPQKYIVWIALDNVIIENGALKVIPGSHKKGFLSYYRKKGETHHTRLDTKDIDVDKYQFVEMKAGDVLIFDQLLVHGSDRVNSNLPRRAFRYAVQGFDQIISPRAVPVVLAGGIPGSYDNSSNREISKKMNSNSIFRKAMHKFARILLKT